MNHWNLDAIAEANRKQIIREVRLIRLEEQPQARKVRGPGWYASSMYVFATWMIHTGKRLRCRYEAPVTGCSHVQTNSFAR